MSSALNIWMNGEWVGTWRVSRGTHVFTYADSWLSSERRRSLSLSLPITGAGEIRGEAVEYFFDNLLPDNPRIRERISRRFGTRNTQVFSLLEAIGRDCVGAVQLLPDDTTPAGWDRIDYEPLTNSQISELLHEVPADRLGDESDADAFRVSLAGAQEKTALLKIGKRWGRPHGATPTTHIIKLPLGLVGGSRQVDLSTSVQNEWLCAQIVGAFGLPVAKARMERFGDQTVLAVERFDRALMGDGRWIARLPQEDFCQALGFPPSRKYEQDRGPGMNACLNLLAGSANADSDQRAFLLTQLVFWLLAATDGHAKNFSIFLNRGDTYAMTPLYDILSCWPYFGNAPNQLRWSKAGMAMAVRGKNAHYSFHTILPRHWHGLAMKHGGLATWEAMRAMIERVDASLAAVEPTLPADFPEHVWETIAKGVRSQAARFRQTFKD